MSVIACIKFSEANSFLALFVKAEVNPATYVRKISYFYKDVQS